MQISLRNALLGMAALGSLAFAAPAAWAGCGDISGLAPANWTPGSADEARLIRVNNGAQSIVGLWSVQFMVGGNLFDFGYAQWHSDGTELMNSGGRSPSSQNFCMGVWDQTSAFGYRLNHFALSYDPTTGKLNAKVNIKELVQVDQKGSDFAGTFTLDVYDPNTNGLLQHVAGQIIGKRITSN